MYKCKFTGEHEPRSAISRKLRCNFTEITFQHRCSPINFLYIFRAPFLKSISGWLFLCRFRKTLLHKIWSFPLEKLILYSSRRGGSLVWIYFFFCRRIPIKYHTCQISRICRESPDWSTKIESQPQDFSVFFPG